MKSNRQIDNKISKQGVKEKKRKKKVIDDDNNEDKASVMLYIYI